MSPARFVYLKESKNSQNGQGIIEIVVVLALAAILILSLVALSVRSNRSANFSKAEDQAARISQEGMEILRNLRDQASGTVYDNSGTLRDWYWIFTQDLSGDEIASFCSSSCINLSLDSDNINLDNRDFTRRIIIRDDVSAANNPCNINGNPSPVTGDWDEIKQFTVEVSWEDTSGIHTTSTNSCLRKSKL